MAGGPPAWPAPMYAQPVFVQPAPRRQAAPPRPAGALPPHRPAVSPTPFLGAQESPRAPVARAKVEDEPARPRPAPLRLPAPEQLGVGAPRPAAAEAAVDWNATHAHLRRLGAVGVQLARLPEG